MNKYVIILICAIIGGVYGGLNRYLYEHVDQTGKTILIIIPIVILLIFLAYVVVRWHKIKSKDYS